MYAIVAVSGHQYRVSPGELVQVNLLPNKEGEVIDLSAVLVVDDKNTSVGKAAEKILVKAQVVRHLQADKIHVRRFRAKSRYSKHIGHRTKLTELKITAIGGHTSK